MPITTRCKHCGRLFPIYAQQLKERRSKVTCPQCGTRFDSLAGLVDEAMPDGMHEAHAQPPPPYFPLVREAMPGDMADASPRNNGHARNADEPAPMMTFDDHEERTGRTASTFWTLGILLSIFLLAAQVFWWERGTWLRYPPVQQVYNELCTRAGLCYAAPRIAGGFEILQPILSEHPLDTRILRLDLTLVNRSEQVQRPPLLQLELFDGHGDLLAVRRFEPEEYLTGTSPITTLAIGSATNIAMELAALDEAPAGFRIQLY